MLNRIKWNAVLLGFCVTTVCAIALSPLLDHFGLNINAGPVDMLTMVSLLVGGFVAGRVGRNFEGIQGAVVAVLYILVIWLGKQVLDEIHIANLAGLGALGKVDSWSNFGKDFFYFVAGTLGGLWATPFNAREHQHANDLLRSVATTRKKPRVETGDAIATDDAPHG